VDLDRLSNWMARFQFPLGMLEIFYVKHHGGLQPGLRPSQTLIQNLRFSQRWFWRVSSYPEVTRNKHGRSLKLTIHDAHRRTLWLTSVFLQNRDIVLNIFSTFEEQLLAFSKTLRLGGVLMINSTLYLESKKLESRPEDQLFWIVFMVLFQSLQ
jgi:hypothetical protein